MTVILSFCLQKLVVDDPWPYAESKSHELIWLLDHTNDRQVADELLYRFQAGMLTLDERGEVQSRLLQGPVREDYE